MNEWTDERPAMSTGRKAALGCGGAAIALSFVIVAFEMFAGTPRDAAAIERCKEAAVDYYKWLGSYPRISDGRLASDLYEEACERTNGKAEEGYRAR